MIAKNKWKKVFIPEVLFFQEGPGVRNTQFRDSGVKLLNVGNINNGVINLESTKTHLSEEEAFGKYSHFLVDDGDLLIACSGIIVNNFHNKIAFASSEHLPLCLNTSTMRFKPLNNESLNIIFFKYYLQSEYFKSQLVKLITGSAQLNFGPSHIKKIQIPLPPLPTQQKIAAILDAADTLRQKDKALLAKYDELTQSLFLDMFGDPVSNPKGWEKRKLNEFLITLVDVGSNGGNDWVSANIKMKDEEAYAIMIRTVNLNKNNFKNNLKYVSEETYNLFKKTKVFGGEIIMNKIGSAGEFWLMPYLNRPVSLGLNQLMMSFNNLDKLFFYYYFSTDYGKKLINSKLNGATTKSITKTALRDLDILYPSLKLQNQFAEHIGKIEQQKALAQASLEKSEELFNSLLQKAFKGELV
jgi:type I restriction enzyme S subunit